MAPELRKRTRSVTAAEKTAAKKSTKAETVDKVEPAAKKTKVEKPAKVAKRKAPEEASPVAQKKQKATKATPTKATPSKATPSKATPSKATPSKATPSKATPSKATPKSKRAAAPVPEPVEEAEPETTENAETSIIPVEDAAVDSDHEVDADIQALAEGLDPEDAPAGDGTVFKPGQDVGKIPKVSKKQKKLTDGSKEEPGVVFISRLPHGFYEHELRGYFSQFGSINRLRLARNKKSGASKHYAFIEFAEQSTAEIVAKTMDSYLLFGHILKVKTVPRASLHENLWKGANRRFKKIPWTKMASNEVAKKRTESTWAQKATREEKKRAERAQKLKALGYDFEAPSLKQAVAPPPEPMAIEETAEPKAVEAAPAEEKLAEEEAPAPATEKDESEEAEKPKATKGKAKKGGKTRKAKA